MSNDNGTRLKSAPNILHVYAEGPFYLSLCTTLETPEEIEAEVNRQRPSGTEGGWKISKDTKFASGEPMPCECESYKDSKHWLLEC